MKINVEFDLTPNEFRQALGLPDVEAFQQELMSRIQKQMEAGVEGYDPMSLFQPFLQTPLTQQPMFKDGFKDSMAQGLASIGNYQQMMLDMLRQAQSASSKAGESPSDADEQAASSAAGTRKKTASGTASATSRNKKE